MEQLPLVLSDVSNRIAWITLNRPEKRNALNFSMISELKAAFKSAIEKPEVKVIVLKANGKAFCAGADLDYIKRLQSYSFQENLQDSSHLMELFQIIYQSPKMVIAQIEGHAIAGGCGLATVCDFAFAVPESKFGYSEVKIGFIPAIVMVFLLRKMGETRAKEFLLTGEIYQAATAADYGLINRVVEADKIADHVKEFAEKLCAQNSAESMALTKRMIGDVQTMPVEPALKFAAKMNAHARESADCKRGITAFLNKEEISW